MPPWRTQVCQRKTFPACAVASLVILVGLLTFVVIYLTLSWQDIVGERSSQDHNDNMHDDCISKATVLTDKALKQRWNLISVNFSQTWSVAEQKARQPAHTYLEKRHSAAIYMYTDIMFQPVKQERVSEQLRERFDSRSLYFSLSEAIQVLKHSQVMCLSTSYRTETLLNQNISIYDKHIRFSTFILGSNEWNLTRNAACFEVTTCFGANITHYSALKQNNQVLIPPYEVFKVTDIQADTQTCNVIYRLKSNLNCVYDRESNMLYPISSLPLEGFWFIFSITCIVILSLLLPFVIVKVLEYHEKISLHTSFLYNTYIPPGVDV